MLFLFSFFIFRVLSFPRFLTSLLTSSTLTLPSYSSSLLPPSLSQLSLLSVIYSSFLVISFRVLSFPYSTSYSISTVIFILSLLSPFSPHVQSNSSFFSFLTSLHFSRIASFLFWSCLTHFPHSFHTILYRLFSPSFPFFSRAPPFFVFSQCFSSIFLSMLSYLISYFLFNTFSFPLLPLSSLVFSVYSLSSVHRYPFFPSLRSSLTSLPPRFSFLLFRECP